MESIVSNNFFDKTNVLINKYSPIVVLLTLLGTVAVGGSYLLSINNHIEHNNKLIKTYYDEIVSQRNILLTFKDTFHAKNENIIKQITKSTTLIDGLNTKVIEIQDSLKTLEARLYYLNTKEKLLDN